MKNLVFILMLFPTLLFSQVRTVKLEPGNILLEPGFGTYSDVYLEAKFQEVDSAFNVLRIIPDTFGISIPVGGPVHFVNNDEIKFNAITDLVFSDSSDSIKVTVNQILQLYWMGYIDGTVNTLEKGRFDREGLKNGILNNKRSINSHFNK